MCTYESVVELLLRIRHGVDVHEIYHRESDQEDDSQRQEQTRMSIHRNRCTVSVHASPSVATVGEWSACAALPCCRCCRRWDRGGLECGFISRWSITATANTAGDNSPRPLECTRSCSCRLASQVDDVAASLLPAGSGRAPPLSSSPEVGVELPHRARTTNLASHALSSHPFLTLVHRSSALVAYLSVGECVGSNRSSGDLLRFPPARVNQNANRITMEERKRRRTKTQHE